MAIDFVLASPDDGEYALVLFEDRPWDEPGVIDDLVERVNRCVAYVVEGQMATDLPETVGRTVRIHVDHQADTDAEIEAVFAHLAAALDSYGISFTTQQAAS